MFWQKVRSSVMFIVSLVICPCHLPIVLPLVLAFLAGTPAAVWIAQNVGWVYGGMTFLFFLSLALGFRWMNQFAEKCESRLVPSANKPMTQTANE